MRTGTGPRPRHDAYNERCLEVAGDKSPHESPDTVSRLGHQHAQQRRHDVVDIERERIVAEHRDELTGGAAREAESRVASRQIRDADVEHDEPQHEIGDKESADDDDAAA